MTNHTFNTISHLVEAYYDALDAGNYDRLTAVLHPEFVQERSDRRFDSRDEFIAFMRDGRPMTETTHKIIRIYPNGPGVAVQGQLISADDTLLFEFVDVFDVENERFTYLRTYANAE